MSKASRARKAAEQEQAGAGPETHDSAAKEPAPEVLKDFPQVTEEVVEEEEEQEEVQDNGEGSSEEATEEEIAEEETSPEPPEPVQADAPDERTPEQIAETQPIDSDDVEHVRAESDGAESTE